MLIEGDHERNGLVLGGVSNGLANNLLMPQMNSVEKADGQGDFAPAGEQFVWGVDEGHGVVTSQNR
jgi:hypothetical protein